MAKRIRIIQVPSGNIEKLCKACRCKRTLVYDALRYKTDSELAKSIRENAVNLYGGVKTTKLVLKQQ